MIVHDRIRSFLKALSKGEIKSQLEIENVAYRLLQDLENPIINREEYEIIPIEAEFNQYWTDGSREQEAEVFKKIGLKILEIKAYQANMEKIERRGEFGTIKVKVLKPKL